MTLHTFTRLPPPTPEGVILAVGLEVMREQLGFRHCRDFLIGARRKRLGPITEDPREWNGDDLEIKMDQSRQALAALCDTCPHRCAMKKWGAGIP